MPYVNVPNDLSKIKTKIAFNVIMADRKKLKSANGLYLGSTGSGKSFAAKRELLNVFLAIPQDRIIVVDPMGEYAPLVERLGGQVIEIAPDSPNHISPMDVQMDMGGGDSPLSLKADFLLSLCELVVGGRDGLQPIEKTVIDRCVRQVYREMALGLETAKTPLLQDLYEELLRQPEPEAKRIATALELYCTGSLNLFNHPTNVNLNSRVVCFVLKGMGENLRKIAMHITNDFVTSAVGTNFKNGVATWCYFDEFHTVVVNEATDFAGTNGCYLYQGRDVQERKNKHLKDQILVLAPSEGLVSSDTWLRCRKKLMANKTFQGGRKAKNTWLAGKVKCGRCGYALMSVGNPTGVQYLRCSKRADSKSCDGCGTLRTREFERFLYGEMVKKLSEFQTLTAKRETVNPKLTALNMELARVEDEIEKLLNTLTGANAVLLSYANSKIEELDTRRQALTKEIAALSAETMSPEQIERLSVYLNQWEEIDFEDRRQVADGLISQIRATDEHVSIEWKI